MHIPLINSTWSKNFTMHNAQNELCTYFWSACRHCVVIPYRAIKNLILIYRGLSEQIYKKSPSAILIQLTCTAMITNKAKLTAQHWVHCVPSHEMIFCSKCATAHDWISPSVYGWSVVTCEGGGLCVIRWIVRTKSKIGVSWALLDLCVCKW